MTKNDGCQLLKEKPLSKGYDQKSEKRSFGLAAARLLVN
jgi:hypothetical protein